MILQAQGRKGVWGGLSALAEEVVATGYRPSITIGGKDTGSTHSCTDTPAPRSRQHQQKPRQAWGKRVMATWGGLQTKSLAHKVQSELARLRSGVSLHRTQCAVGQSSGPWVAAKRGPHEGV